MPSADITIASPARQPANAARNRWNTNDSIFSSEIERNAAMGTSGSTAREAFSIPAVSAGPESELRTIKLGENQVWRS